MDSMPDNKLRYSGPPTVRESYMNEFAVACPKCQHEALVTADRPYWQNAGKLTCKNCMHAEKAVDLVRYKSIVKRHCDNCGKEFESIIPNQKEIVEKITIPCPHCGITRTYKPKHEEYKVGYQKNEGANDPIFSLPLWLQAEVRGNSFWAYNRQHLNEIKSYVTSKLRERQTTTHTTMVERLPNFIKDAKNRQAIIKAIEKLERKQSA
jgi:DNA-directed RNA polymerase subunit RPC12/RpoP